MQVMTRYKLKPGQVEANLDELLRRAGSYRFPGPVVPGIPGQEGRA